MMNAIAIDDEPLALKVIESFCGKTDYVTLQKTFTKPAEALKYLRKYPVDLIFVDIYMPSITGINLVKAIEQHTIIIFTTAYSQYAVESYELNAIDYLLKPISQKRFLQAVKKANDYYQYLQQKDHSKDTCLYIRADYSLIKIPVEDIIYIEGLADYLKIFVKNRNAIVARMTMKEMIDKLPAGNFVRVHRSYIIPINAIQSVRNGMIYITDTIIPIGRTFADEFYNRYKT